MKLAVLYAGQGAQHPGMGKEFYEASPAFRAAFDSAALDFDLHRVCFEDPDGVLNQTEYTQPCMVAFACGVTAVLAEKGVKPAYLAGLSLGEYSALQAAGVFTAKQAIELTAFRGKAMAEAAKGLACGMTAVLGLDREKLSACCEQAAETGCVQICNYNCPGQLVIGGEKAAVEQAAALAKEQAAPDAPQNEEELLTAAVNRTILEGFDPLYRQLVQEQQLVPVTDPDFELLAVNKTEGFRAGAQFYALPPLELGRDTGFVQAIEPHPLRRLTIELEINRSYGDEERAADAAGKAALRDRVTRELYAKRCAQARDRAEKELVWQLGDEVTGPVPKRLEAGNYFAEQRQFNLGLQANGVNFDQFLAVRGQTVEQFRQWLHWQAERKLRSWLGLLLVAEREGLQPPEAEVNAALADWDEKLDGERTFPANDTRKVRQRLARAKATAFVVEHSTLTPPPAEPLVQEPEAK